MFNALVSFLIGGGFLCVWSCSFSESGTAYRGLPHWRVLIFHDISASFKTRGDDLPFHPVKNVIFILLYRMSPFPTQLQFYVIELLYAPGDIFIECQSLL